MMGISRSATAVCAYLVATTSMTAVEAIEFVRSKRSVISPNLGFRSQLDTYEEQLYEAGLKERVLPASKRSSRKAAVGASAALSRLMERRK